MSTLTDKVATTAMNNGDQPAAAESNYLLCCFFRLYNNSLLNTICLIDMLFYLVALTFNLTWTLFEVINNREALGSNGVPLHILYSVIMAFNVAVLIYSIHFKLKYRKYNMLVRNTYFEVYYYLRICWGLLSCSLSIAIFVLLLTAHVDQHRFSHFKQFFRISNIFSLLYLLYAIFCFSSSPGFKKSWYAMLAKDINFYFE